MWKRRRCQDFVRTRRKKRPREILSVVVVRM
jgi:hypothetical protein